MIIEMVKDAAMWLFGAMARPMFPLTWLYVQLFPAHALRTVEWLRKKDNEWNQKQLEASEEYRRRRINGSLP